MAMTLPKFIICINGVFRLGMVNQHSLVNNALVAATTISISFRT